MNVAPSSAQPDHMRDVHVADDAGYNLTSHYVLAESAMAFFLDEITHRVLDEASRSICKVLPALKPPAQAMPRELVSAHSFGPLSTECGTMFEPTVSSFLVSKLTKSLTTSISGARALLGSSKRMQSVLQTPPASDPPLLWMSEEPFPLARRSASAGNAFSDAKMNVDVPMRPRSQGRADIVLNLDYSESPLQASSRPACHGVLPTAFFELGKCSLPEKESQACCVAVGLGQHLTAANVIFPLLGVLINANFFLCRAYLPLSSGQLATVEVVPATSVSEASIARLLRTILCWTVAIHDLIESPGVNLFIAIPKTRVTYNRTCFQPGCDVRTLFMISI
jgi:hypothetical protein